MNRRMERADSEIQKELAEIIKTELNDPRLQTLISVTYVKTSPDFTYVKAGVSIYEQDKDKRNEVLDLLQKSSGFIKRNLAERLELRNVPNIKFILDDGSFYEDRINKILESMEISKEEEIDNE